MKKARIKVSNIKQEYCSYLTEKHVDKLLQKCE